MVIRRESAKDAKLLKKKLKAVKSRCVMGSSISIERKVASKNFILCRNDAQGLTCQTCSRYTCKQCIEGLLKVIKKKDLYGSGKRSKVREYMSFLAKKRLPKTCHACFIGRSEKKWKDEHVSTQKMCSEGLKYDGMLVFPEFNLGIDSPLADNGIVDVHGLGTEKKYNLKAAKHFVLSMECAHKCYTEDIHLTEIALHKGCDGIRVFKVRELQVRDYLDVTVLKTVKVKIVIVKQANDPIPISKGENNINLEYLSRLRYFSEKAYLEECDVTLILGEWDGVAGAYSLLLSRWHHVWEERPLSQKGVESLYSEVSKMTDFGNVVRRRSGGSSGKSLGLSKVYKDLIKYPGNCPKRGIGQFLAVNDDGVNVYYKAADGKFKCALYSIPQYGGQFDCKGWLMEKFDFLYDFAEVKIHTAVLLLTINCSGTLKKPITPCAVASELLNVDQCVELGKAMEAEMSGSELGNQWRRPVWESFFRRKSKKTRNLLKGDLTFRRKVLVNYANFNRHTLVQHQVGLHKDSFGSKKVSMENVEVHSLENKVCFSAEGGLFNKFGIGRGGGGKLRFTFAILDWENQRPGRRRIAMGNVLSAQDLPRRVTEAVWAAFRIQFPAAAEAVDAEFDDV